MPFSESDVVTNPPTNTERPDLYRYLIVGLLIVTGLAILFGALLAWFGKAVPDNLWAIGLVAVGALAGMLAPRAA